MAQSGFGLGYNVRRYFFDTKAVLRAVDRATLSVLRRAGGTIRKIARSSIRKGKKPSKPGTPPKSHTGRLRDGIWFAFNPGSNSVVVGPVRYNQVDLYQGEWVSGTIPQVLEEGGRIGIAEQQIIKGGRWSRIDKRRKANDNPKRIRTVAIEARPYMVPALEKAQPYLAKFWQNSIKR